MKHECKDCAFVDNFSPRQDEIDRGLTLGCKKPGYEGYTRNDSPACGGVFFMKALKQEVADERR